MPEQITVLPDGLLVTAPAKINLSLLIAGKRPDGFHEIDTIMAKIDLCDQLLFQHSDKPGIELICNGRYPVGSNEDNLVYRACKMICDIAGITPAIKVTLTKNIPIGAGLGGGSSDAAAALTGLNIFADLGLEKEKLVEAAARLGSDIPFFLGGPLAICTGRGEKIEEIKENFSFQAILMTPNVSVATAGVYRNYAHRENTYRTLKTQIYELISKKKFDLIAQLCANMLEESCFQLYGKLADMKRRVESLGGIFQDRVCLSGSGSAMFCICTSASSDIKGYQSILTEKIGCDSVIVNNNRW
jgi:4-diphosphocytidyl-2-C-methyl-D-erythritol kinase